MVIITPEELSSKNERQKLRIFRIMNQAKVIVTSDSIKAVSLFLQMRRVE